MNLFFSFGIFYSKNYDCSNYTPEKKPGDTWVFLLKLFLSFMYSEYVENVIITAHLYDNFILMK